MVFKIIGTPGRVCIKQAIQEANGNPCIRMVAHVMELDLESRDSENESLGSYDDDDDDDQQGDDERTKSDDDKSVDLNKTDDEEETQEDVFHRLKDAELIDEGKGDEEMTDAEKVNPELEEVNQEVERAQVQDEAQATTTADPAQVASSSRSVSSNYGSIFLNLDNISSVETKIISMLDVQVQHEVPIALKEFDQKRTLFETITKSKSFDRNPKHKALYHALMESILKDEDAMDKGVVDKKTSKDAEPSKKVKSTDTSEGTTKSQPKSTGKFAQSKEIVFEAGDTQLPQKLGEDMGKTDEPPIVNADPKDCDLAKAEKPSKMLNELMSTPINFTAFAMNHLQISDLTKTYLVPVYNLLKGTLINVKVNKWYGYGHLEEIEVRRSDQKLYKFMEGDFLRIHLNDIEDMLLLWLRLGICPTIQPEPEGSTQDIPLDRIEVHRKYLHLLHMDLFGPISPMSINHDKYTLVIVDEYSRMVENQNYVKVKQIRTDNGTEFRNFELKSFCDENGISQNFTSPYTSKQNGVVKRKNITLIEAARTMLNGLVLSKHFGLKQLELPVTLRLDQSMSKDIIRLPMRYLEKGSLISSTFMCLDV
ncbi:retrovirus-related pol polyprotein from transposon TNT 1-94 [Tanacetum coccineum]|uniref:Retrovirus-related pol polyprotein from transposon TNT 1-94 n=1 Tax=Tanacetum coccineum TaxID=301880 RepID=A0ABQ5G6J7_9ASTR